MKNYVWDLVEEISVSLFEKFLAIYWQDCQSKINIDGFRSGEYELTMHFVSLKFDSKSSGNNIILDLLVESYSLKDGETFNSQDSQCGTLYVFLDLNQKKVISIETCDLAVSRRDIGLISNLLKEYFAKHPFDFSLFYDISFCSPSTFIGKTILIYKCYIVETDTSGLFLIRCWGGKADSKKPASEDLNVDLEYRCWINRKYVIDKVITPYLKSILHNYHGLNSIENDKIVFNKSYQMKSVNISLDKYVPNINDKTSYIEFGKSEIIVYLSGKANFGGGAKETFTSEIAIEPKWNAESAKIEFGTDVKFTPDKDIPWYLYLSVGGGIAAEVLISKSNEQIKKYLSCLPSLELKQLCFRNVFKVVSCKLSYELGVTLKLK